MKIRQGFVSNSSSSSFICVIGKVTNEEKLNDYIRSKRRDIIWNRVYYGHELKDAIEEDVCDFEDYVNVPDDINPNDQFVIFSEAGDEGDCYFMSGSEDDWDEPNYDIDLDFFSDDVQELTELTPEKHGVQIIDVTYYAGRNG